MAIKPKRTTHIMQLLMTWNGNVSSFYFFPVLFCVYSENSKKTQAEEEYQRWLKEREDRRMELERACRSVPSISLAVSNIRRESSLSEPSSDADSPLSEPLAVDVPEEVSIKPLTVPTPTSPLLTSLLKSPAGATAALLSPTPVTPPSSILHSVITSPLRVAAIPGRINTSPSKMKLRIVRKISQCFFLFVSVTVSPNIVSPNIKSLVSSALGSLDDQKPVVQTQSPSQGKLHRFLVKISCCELLVTAFTL